MQSTNDYLLQSVKAIESELHKQINSNFTSAMHSRPEWIQFYNDMIKHYEKGIKLCQEYYDDKEITKLSKGLLNDGFACELITLKQYVPDDQKEARIHISLAEEEIYEIMSMVSDIVSE